MSLWVHLSWTVGVHVLVFASVYSSMTSDNDQAPQPTSPGIDIGLGGNNQANSPENPYFNGDPAPPGQNSNSGTNSIFNTYTAAEGTTASVTLTATNHSKSCVDSDEPTEEPFVMRLNLCRPHVSIRCQIGGLARSNCLRDKEAFRATAIVAKHLTQCLIEANTTALKYIRFVVKAKYLKNEDGNRGLGEEVQRGRCNLGYTCVDNKYLKEITSACYSFEYSGDDAYNGTKSFRIWTAPPNYDGPVEFSTVIRVSYNSFFVDVSKINIQIADPPTT